jgi:hypothetical protein
MLPHFRQYCQQSAEVPEEAEILQNIENKLYYMGNCTVYETCISNTEDRHRAKLQTLDCRYADPFTYPSSSFLTSLTGADRSVLDLSEY